MSGCSAWRGGTGGSNSNKLVASFTGRHLRRGDSREADPQLAWTRMGDTRHAEAVGIRVILGGLAYLGTRGQEAGDTPPRGVQVEQ